MKERTKERKKGRKNESKDAVMKNATKKQNKCEGYSKIQHF
jgi:hypothetical protein